MLSGGGTKVLSTASPIIQRAGQSLSKAATSACGGRESGHTVSGA